MIPSQDDMVTLAVKLWGEPTAAYSSRKELRFGKNESKSLRTGERIFFDYEADRGGGYRDLHKLVHGQFPPPNGEDVAADFATLARKVFRQTPVAWWDYHDKSGAVVARVVRLKPPGADKTYRQCRPDGAGGWKWSLQGLQVPLYRLPELLAAPTDATVYVVEGEKQADALHEWGLIGTTNCMGANKFRAHHAETLAGRTVVILPDNDAPGREHARRVARDLRGVGARACILELPGQPEKGDIVDWIAAGHTPDELAELVAVAWAQAGASPDPAPELSDEAEDATIARLARLSLLQYERVRTAEAERLNCRAGMLDKLVRAAREGGQAADGQGQPLNIPPPDAWPDPVDGASLLFELAKFFGDHLYLPHRASTALALWTVHTHCAEAFAHTPRLIVKSAEKGSGKSTLFDLLKLVANKPVETESISPAALFRTVAKAKPTVLMDEADTFVRDNEDLRGLLNAGYKRGGQTIRCVGEDQEPRMFDVFSPIALAGLGKLPGTIVDRAITITMRRARRGELPQPIRRPTEELGNRLARQATRWAADHAAVLAETEPDMGELFNRPADVWRPLYAIAGVAGDTWPDLARSTMEALTGEARDDAEGLGVKLLRDVRMIFAGQPEMTTRELVESLVQMEDRPWPEMGRTGKPLTVNRFTLMVQQFGASRARLSTEGRPWGLPAGGLYGGVCEVPRSVTRFSCPFLAYKVGTLGQTLRPQGLPAFPSWDTENPCPNLVLQEMPAAVGHVPMSHFCTRFSGYCAHVAIRTMRNALKHLHSRNSNFEVVL